MGYQAEQWIEGEVPNSAAEIDPIARVAQWLKYGPSS